MSGQRGQEQQEAAPSREGANSRLGRDTHFARWSMRDRERSDGFSRGGAIEDRTASRRRTATPERVYTLLVVEDDEVLRDAYSEGLSVAGYCVRTASSAPSAREAMQHGAVDLVLTDVNLNAAGGDGYTVLEEARRSRPGAPVIVVTGTDEPTGGARAIAAGAFAYLLKPVTLAELRSTVARALQGLDSLRSRRT
jgi:CheY-like chemotaxis protein